MKKYDIILNIKGEFEMIKVLFVCLGNICRSPMAEFMFKDKIRRRNLVDHFFITSRATSYEEQGT